MGMHQTLANASGALIACLIMFSANDARAATLTVCNATDNPAFGVFFDPVVSGYGHSVSVAAGACTALPNFPQGQYKISLYMGTDCFRPVSVFGDVTYTFDRAAKAICDKENGELYD